MENEYRGGTPLWAGLERAGSNDYALVQAKDVWVSANKRLDVVLQEISSGGGSDIDSALPIPIETEAEMVEILSNATAKSLGEIYKYMGEDTANFTQGMLYIITEDDAETVGISDVELTSSDDEGSTYTIILTNGKTRKLRVKSDSSGGSGVGIVSIEKTATEGLVDTYTITFTDGTTSTFTVTNGKDGVGVQRAVINANGDLVIAYTNGTNSNLGKVVGEKGADGRGIVSIDLTSTVGRTKTYTITYTDNTASTFKVMDGATGPQGAGLQVVTTSGTNKAYTAYVSSITSLTVGATFIMVPHSGSSLIGGTITLNVNSLGAKEIKRRYNNNANTYADAGTISFGKPYRVMYDGAYWILVDYPKLNASDLTGTFPSSYLSGYQTKTDGTLATEDKTIVGAINELNSKAIDKIVALNLASGSNSNVTTYPDGIHWDNEETEVEIAGSDFARFCNHSMVPIVAGEGIAFEVDEDNQVVKINATGGGSGDTSSGMPQIRFVGMPCEGWFGYVNWMDIDPDVQADPSYADMKFTIEIVGGGSLQVGDRLQICRMCSFGSSRNKQGKYHPKKKKLRKILEYTITENDLDKRFITMTINGGSKEAYRLFTKNNNCSSVLGYMYFRIRRAKGPLNSRGGTDDAEFSNIVPVLKSATQYYWCDPDTQEDITYCKLVLI